MRSFRIRSSATSKSLARLLLYKVLVEDHAPSATPQDAVHVIVVHVLGSTVHEHVFRRSPTEHSVGLAQDISEPCHRECQ